MTSGAFDVSTLRGALDIAAIACLVVVVLLGAAVSRRPPSAFDRTIGRAALGKGKRLAFAFTLLGRAREATVICVLALIVGRALHDTYGAFLLVAAQTLCQAADVGIKLLFLRARPAEWLGMKEPDKSFPSGHSATGAVLFGGGAIMIAHTALPPLAMTIALVVLIACAIGVPWSRLALGAHWATDVLGGIVFGAGFLCLALAELVRVTGG